MRQDDGVRTALLLVAARVHVHQDLFARLVPLVLLDHRGIVDLLLLRERQHLPLAEGQYIARLGDPEVGFGRIVVSEIEAPIRLVDLV